MATIMPKLVSIPDIPGDRSDFGTLAHTVERSLTYVFECMFGARSLEAFYESAS